MAQKITRGTLKRFEVYITDLGGEEQDPEGGCEVTLIKQGEYSYDSPKGPYTCENKSAVKGFWAADVYLSRSMTLGNWVAHFSWRAIVGGPEDSAYFNFIVVDMVRPYINQINLPPNVGIVG